MAQASGKATIEIDNVALRTKKGAKIDLGGEKRNADATDQALVFFTAENVPAMVEGTIVHMSDTDLIALRDAKNVTINFRTDTGVLYVVSNAFLTEPPTLQNGECPVKFAGSAAKQG